MKLAQMMAGWDGLCGWAWRTSLAASVLIGLVFTLQMVLGRHLSVRTRYLLSLLVLVRLVMPAIPAILWSPLRVQQAAWQLEAAAPRRVEPVMFAWEEPAGRLPGSTDAVCHPNRTAWGRARTWRTVLQACWTLGVFGALAAVGWQHRRLAKWIRRQEHITDGSILLSLERGKELMGVSRHIGLIAALASSVPTLWGWRNPILLLPARSLERLSASELKLVFLHELAHVKRRDILLNWLMILGQSLHWFNPLVWTALRRLRADRELVCDEMVLHLIAPPERTAYGKTLLKLLEDTSGAPFRPGLVPILNNKHEAKRRITMIANFKPVGRPATLAGVALLILVCWLNFTRAAAPTKAEPVPAPPTTHLAQVNPPAPLDTPTAETRKPQDQPIEIKGLRKRLTELESRIARQQEKINLIRQELGGLSDVGQRDTTPTLEPETIRLIERERISAEAASVRYETLYHELKSINPSQLAQALPTALPDQELSQLLRDLNAAETQHTKLTQDFGSQHTQVQQTAAVRDVLGKQIQARIDGILAGLQAQVAAQTASAVALSNQVQAAKLREAELTPKYRAYFLAKRELERLQKLHEAVVLKLWTTEFGIDESDLP